MKKLFLAVAAGFLLITGCHKSTSIEDDLQANDPVATARKCAAQEILELQMQADPSLRQRREAIEEFTQRILQDPNAARLLPNGIMEIPVVVNVLYKSSAQNISLAQIESQITALNKDFSATNSDYSSVPSVFQAVRSGDVEVRFVLDAVNRRQTSKKSWQLNDAMKKSQQGGIDATDPTTKLNIWVCNLTGGYLGYAQFPGGAPSTDGVVCDDNAFGTTGTAQAPFDKGRTATHEIGHWMNLRHIWGDATCGTDGVNDTPPHRTYNFGCPGVIAITCTNNATTNPYGFNREMTMNYMDYTDDPCMFMFTALQKTRMQAVFAVGGPRESFR